MSQDHGEKPVVKTTIVGARPPGSGKGMDDIPRGIEILLKKAAVDESFRNILLSDPLNAADAIALKLQDAEVAVLKAIPDSSLEQMIAATKVQPKMRQAFMGYTAAVMLAALTVAVPGMAQDTSPEGSGQSEAIKVMAGIIVEESETPFSAAEMTAAKRHKFKPFMNIAPQDEMAPRGNLVIRIEDWQKGILPGFVRIHITKIESSTQSKESVTEGLGYARRGYLKQENIPAGEYLVEAALDDFAYAKAKRITVAEKKTATLYFKVRQYNPDEGKPIRTLGIVTDIE